MNLFKDSSVSTLIELKYLSSKKIVCSIFGKLGKDGKLIKSLWRFKYELEIIKQE